MDLEQMKLEALARQIAEVSQKISTCLQIVNATITSAKDENIPVDLIALKAANADRYAEAVHAVQAAVAELETSWPV